MTEYQRKGYSQNFTETQLKQYLEEMYTLNKTNNLNIKRQENGQKSNIAYI